MSAPERIWACHASYDGRLIGMHDGEISGWDEYIRADLVQAALDEAKMHHAQAFGAGVDHGATLSAALELPEIKVLVDAAKGLLFAHDHGNGLEGWHNTRERMRAALRAIMEGQE